MMQVSSATVYTPVHLTRTALLTLISATTCASNPHSFAFLSTCFRVLVLCNEYTAVLDIRQAASKKRMSMPLFLVPKGGFMT